MRCTQQRARQSICSGRELSILSTDCTKPSPTMNIMNVIINWTINYKLYHIIPRVLECSWMFMISWKNWHPFHHFKLRAQRLSQDEPSLWVPHGALPWTFQERCCNDSNIRYYVCLRALYDSSKSVKNVVQKMLYGFRRFRKVSLLPWRIKSGDALHLRLRLKIKKRGHSWDTQSESYVRNLKFIIYVHVTLKTISCQYFR